MDFQIFKLIHHFSSEKLDLAILIDNSSWTLKSFIAAGGDRLRESLESDMRKVHVDVRVACVQYGILNQPIANDSETKTDGFCSNVPDSFLKQFIASDDALTTAIEKTCELDWRKDARKICYVITDNPPSALCAECKPPMDILKLTRKLGGKGVVLNTIGIEPRLRPYRDFFMTLSYITGGRYIALTDPSKLATVIAGAAQEDISLEKVLHLVDQNAVDCIHSIGPSENDVGQFYNGCDQHFIDIYKEMLMDGRPPETIHFRDSNYKNVFVTPLARYLSTLSSLDELKKKCPSWPLPWPVQYHLPQAPPHYCRPGPPPPPVRAISPPPSSSSSISTSEMPPRKPLPPSPPPSSLQSPAVSNGRLSAWTPISKSTHMHLPSEPPTTKTPQRSKNATQSSTAPPPDFMRFPPPHQEEIYHL